ncbi:YT521-B-like domain-containing protein [Mycena vulgaris]|nr:YT521-B-like domain-containing protein [Mycena vulgaris]
MSWQEHGGSDQSHRSSQQRGFMPGYQSPDAPFNSLHPPLSTSAGSDDPSLHAPYSGQHFISPQRGPPLTMVHPQPPTFGYPPSFPVQEQPQSIHGGYTLASYYSSNTPLSPVHGLQFSLPVPAGYASPPAPTAASPVQARRLYLYPPTHVAHSRGGMLSHQNRTSSYFAQPLAYPISSQPLVDHPPYTAPTSRIPPSSSSGTSLVPLPHGERLGRRASHPSPPAQRSEWAMWAGNIASDADHDELWGFFTQRSSSSGNTDGSAPAGASSGVISIFLIRRSKCAFINYETELHLENAIARFNGVPLRTDPGCARLVCRVRLKDADLRRGVGGQRGMGMRMGLIRSQAQQGNAAHDPRSSTATGRTCGHSDPDVNPKRPPPRPSSAASSSASLASTNSSLLQRYFPQRFFILKSLTRSDLDLSVRTGVWVTQKHNEGVLDRAFRTAEDVFLIFSVNKSGEFYGYARMVGQVGEGPSATHDIPMLHAPRAQLLIAERLVENSPHSPSSPPPPRDVHSAPAQLGPQHKTNDASKASLDQHLSAKSPERRGLIWEEGEGVESLGQEFKLQWICTAPLPFQRTQHIRNPWNRHCAVKVSRDGTELEPSIGEALLEEWRLFLAAQAVCNEATVVSELRCCQSNSHVNEKCQDAGARGGAFDHGHYVRTGPREAVRREQGQRRKKAIHSLQYALIGIGFRHDQGTTGALIGS